MDIFIDNRNGNVWQVSGEALKGVENSGMVADVSWKTQRINGPSSLDITLIRDGIYQNKNFAVNPGDVVRVTKGEHNVFYGYVFSVDISDSAEMKITAYDQIRYLMANDTYVFKNLSAGDVIKRIADDFSLKVGSLAATGYTIPSMIEDNQKLLDIVYKALALTVVNTGQIYVFWDNFGSLTLTRAADMLLSLSIGDESLMTGFGYKRSIDDDTYNYIKLSRKNKKTGKRDVYVYQDSGNIAKWGRLQLYEDLDENINEAQANAKAQQLLSLKNREGRNLTVEAIGDFRVRAGCYLPIFIDDIKASQVFLVEQCTHKISGNDHKMSLELKVN